MAVPDEGAFLTFDRLGEQYQIHIEEWANIILLLEDWGWVPELRRTFYLATGIDISDDDARNLARTGEKLLQAAFKDPLSVYPIRADMSKVYEVVEFCGQGGFRICE